MRFIYHPQFLFFLNWQVPSCDQAFLFLRLLIYRLPFSLSVKIISRVRFKLNSLMCSLPWIPQCFRS